MFNLYDSLQQKPCPPQEPAFLINSAITLRTWLGVCPHSQTLTAHSLYLGQPIFMALPCKQWKCPKCARDKIIRLADRTKDAKPNRLLTLTVDPALHQSPRGAFDATRRQVSELFRKLRPKFGEIEYLRVVEVTKKGWPHYHLLIRSGYLPHPSVKAAWQDLTGATIVDLRKVERTFNAYWYLVKYLSKLHSLEWTDRHVAYSRHFFPPLEPKQSPDLQLQLPERIGQAPWNYLAETFPGSTLYRYGRSLWTLEPPDTYQPDEDFVPWPAAPVPSASESPAGTPSIAHDDMQRHAF